MGSQLFFSGGSIAVEAGVGSLACGVAGGALGYAVQQFSGAAELVMHLGVLAGGVGLLVHVGRDQVLARELGAVAELTSAGRWQRMLGVVEGQTIALPIGAHVRWGVDGHWVARVVEGARGGGAAAARRC